VRRFLMFAYWFSPVLLIMYFYFLFEKVKRRKTGFIVPEDYFFLVLVAGYFLYYEIGGNQYGPRFYLEALPFLILLVVRKSFLSDRKWAKAMVAAAMIVAIIKIPVIAWREHEIVEERLDVYKLVNEQNLSNAVVLLSTGTSVTRPMPSGDLTRNDQDYQNSVLYAIDHQDANPLLMDYYKDRAFYRYVRGREDTKGKLERIR
jgi:hypothetical protein